MLKPILQYFSVVFPNTFTRLAHWHLLFLDDNNVPLDLQSLIMAILPTCVFIIYGLAAARRIREDDNGEDDNDEDLPEYSLGPFSVLIDCIEYWVVVYKAFDVVAALDVVLRASGFFGKVLLAIDLLIEGTLVLLAKLTFFVLVGVFVGAAFEGFPFVKDFCITVWMYVQIVILNKRPEAPADDMFDEE